MSDLKNIRLLIEYEGTAYSGWQIQDNGDTIQGRLTDAIFRTTGQRVNLIGAGRTDAGVHALGQVANFLIDHRLEPERYAPALNYYLRGDIRVLSSAEVPEGFHARFSAKSRQYRYLVSHEVSALYRNLRYQFRQHVDFGRLQDAAAKVLGERDFSPFCVVASRKENNVCRVEHSRWYRYGPLMVYEIRANRFLHGMVRSLVGAMLNQTTLDPDDNELNLTPETFSDMLSTPNGRRVAFTAPACGLYLVRVIY
ncbi:MAG: tRNA pseudouridine(38-40) synthase TruA [Candidatus Zixiibacteriota bacterium]